MDDQLNIILQILGFILTGGFLAVIFQTLQLSRRIEDRYDSIMCPFMYKLSNYLKYISFARSFYRRPRKTECSENMKSLISDFDSLGFTK